MNRFESSTCVSLFRFQYRQTFIISNIILPLLSIPNISWKDWIDNMDDEADTQPGDIMLSRVALQWINHALIPTTTFWRSFGKQVYVMKHLTFWKPNSTTTYNSSISVELYWIIVSYCKQSSNYTSEFNRHNISIYHDVYIDENSLSLIRIQMFWRGSLSEGNIHRQDSNIRLTGTLKLIGI